MITAFRAIPFSIMLSVLGSVAVATCSDDAVELRGDFGAARFTVEVADDVPERSRGLMDRETLAASAGMLFVYQRPERAGFWMRNTLIPLDMIFADETGTVTKVHENAIPRDETLIDGGPGVQFVLEINGGLAGPIGIAPGAQLRHPSIDAAGQAAWPCE